MKKEQNTQPVARTQLTGYPHIEALLESEDFDRINKTFSDAYQKLEKIAKDSSLGLQARKNAQEAMQAYELTAELVKQLLQVKYNIMKQSEQSGQTNPPPRQKGFTKI